MENKEEQKTLSKLRLRLLLLWGSFLASLVIGAVLIIRAFLSMPVVSVGQNLPSHRMEVIEKAETLLR